MYPEHRSRFYTLSDKTRMQSDRFAREIVPFLMQPFTARSRRLMRKPLSGPIGKPAPAPGEVLELMLRSHVSVGDGRRR